MHSLRARLFVFLLALAGLSAAAVGGATYFSVRSEIDELFDYHLRQMALSLRDQGRIADDERAALQNPEFDYVVQVWSADGVALYSSRPESLREAPPPRAVLGFSDVQLDGGTWRVFSAATPVRVVQVGQPLAVRRRLAAAAAGRSVLPIVVAAPLVAFALWALVSLSLAPLTRAAAAARERNERRLDPLPLAGMPSEVEPLVASFNALLARLASAFEAQRAFVADAAHELRTPLTALKLQLGLLRDAASAEQRQVALDRLRSGIDRATRLVEQLLALARAEPDAPDAPATLVPIDLAALARETVADAALLASQHGATIELHAAAAAPLAGDAAALRSLLRNLLDNAVLHGGPAPRIEVTVQRDARGVRLVVDDNGLGIPPAERERVFARFARREGSAVEGSGLGLAIVRAVAARHGASVVLGDSPLGGLRAEVTFPAGG
jgi:two-component system OmpR family sensor kinase/two-component system sensor histidine kinase QseC